jgi:uncharacterized protein (TIGR04255 family)
MLEHLIPVSRKHSIGKVTATIFLPQKMLKPENIFNKLTNNQEFARIYPKRNLIHLHNISINANDNSLNTQTKEKLGFTFENYDERGRLSNVFKLENRSDNQATISFETRTYTTWENFYSSLEHNLKLFSESFPFYIAAISLVYNDNFSWVTDSPIPVREIFRADSELISEKFLNSDSSNSSVLSQTFDESFAYEERVEIAFSNRVKKVTISHHFVKRFDNLELSSDILENNIFRDSYQNAHDINKDVLKDILSDAVLEKIGLKK